MQYVAAGIGSLHAAQLSYLAVYAHFCTSFKHTFSTSLLSTQCVSSQAPLPTLVYVPEVAKKPSMAPPFPIQAHHSVSLPILVWNSVRRPAPLHRNDFACLFGDVVKEGISTILILPSSFGIHADPQIARSFLRARQLPREQDERIFCSCRKPIHRRPHNIVIMIPRVAQLSSIMLQDALEDFERCKSLRPTNSFFSHRMRYKRITVSRPPAATSPAARTSHHNRVSTRHNHLKSRKICKCVIFDEHCAKHLYLMPLRRPDVNIVMDAKHEGLCRLRWAPTHMHRIR